MRTKKKLSVLDLMALDRYAQPAKRRREKEERQQTLMKVVEYVRMQQLYIIDDINITDYCHTLGITLTQSEVKWIAQHV